MNPKHIYSVIIPVYNREKEIERALRSVKKQTYRPIEVIIVDNNSTDSTISRCNLLKKELEEEELSILIDTEIKYGANAARNKGIRLAQGKYVLFLDSDDEMLPQKIAQIDTIINIKNPDLVITNVTVSEKSRSYLRMNLSPATLPYQITRSFMCTSNMTFKREFITSIGGWDENLYRWQDWEIGIRALLYTHSVVVLNKPLDINHIHDESITGKCYAHPDNILLSSIKKAISAVSESDAPNKKTLLCLLYFRIFLLAGLYHREKVTQLCSETLEYARQISKHENWMHRLKLNLLYYYTRFHGKGAWYLAMLFFKDLK